MLLAIVFPIAAIVSFIVGIYFFVKRKDIIKKYDISYITSFFFSAFTLAPLFVGIPALLFAPPEQGILIFLGSLLYPILPMIICLAVSKGKPYRIRRMFVMMAFTVSLGGFLLAYHVKEAKKKRKKKSTEQMVRDHIENEEIRREVEMEDAYWRRYR